MLRNAWFETSIVNIEVVSVLPPNGSQAPSRPIEHLTAPKFEIPPKRAHANDATVGNMSVFSCGKFVICSGFNSQNKTKS